MYTDSPLDGGSAMSGDPDSISGEDALRLYRQADLGPQGRFLDFGGDKLSGTGISADQTMVQTMIAAATLAVLAFEQDPDNEQAKQLLGRWTSWLVKVARGMRMSQQWVDQESADAIEIWLLGMLSRESSQSLRDMPFYSEAVSLLGDQSGRSRARRRAVLASWRRAQRESSGGNAFHSIGGYTLGHDRQSLTKRRWTSDMTADAFVAATLRLIEVGSSGKSTEAIRRQLHDLIVGPRIRFEDGPYSDRLRAGRETDLVQNIEQTIRYPANQWYAPWESEAAELAGSSIASDQNSGDQNSSGNDFSGKEPSDRNLSDRNLSDRDPSDRDPDGQK